MAWILGVEGLRVLGLGHEDIQVQGCRALGFQSLTAEGVKIARVWNSG